MKVSDKFFKKPKINKSKHFNWTDFDWAIDFN